jgi:hypothetical protein
VPIPCAPLSEIVGATKNECGGQSAAKARDGRYFSILTECDGDASIAAEYARVPTARGETMGHDTSADTACHPTLKMLIGEQSGAVSRLWLLAHGKQWHTLGSQKS